LETINKGINFLKANLTVSIAVGAAVLAGGYYLIWGKKTKKRRR